MTRSSTILAGTALALCASVSLAWAQSGDPLFGDQPAQPQPQQPQQQASIIQALTPAQMVQVVSQAGLQAQVLRFENGREAVQVRNDKNVEMLMIPICNDTQAPCFGYKILSQVANGPVGGDIYLRFHNRSFSAFFDRTPDGKLTILSDGMSFQGGIGPGNLAEKLRIFGIDYDMARQTIQSGFSQNTTRQDSLKLTSLVTESGDAGVALHPSMLGYLEERGFWIE